MDAASVLTPTRSEINTFRVMANTDFTNWDKSDPNRLLLGGRTLLTPPASSPQITPPRTPQRTPLPPSPPASPIIVEDHASVVQEPSSPPRVDPEVRAQARKTTEHEILLEKEGLLNELALMEKQGLVKLHRQLSISDSLEEIQFQYDRASGMLATAQAVEWAKTGIKMGSGLLEGLVKRMGVGVADGFSNNLCKDMSKFNRPLTRVYRKYWRRGNTSPEMELFMIVAGALVMTVYQNKNPMGTARTEPMARPVPPAPEWKAPTIPAAPTIPTVPLRLPAAPPLIRIPAAWQTGVPKPQEHVKQEPVRPEPVKQEPIRPEMDVKQELTPPRPEAVRRINMSSPTKTSRRRAAAAEALNLDS